MANIVAENPDHIFIEYGVNDSAFNSFNTDRTEGWWPAAEALIVQLRTQLPNAKLAFVCLTKQEEYTDEGHITARDNWIAICNHHDIPIYRIDLWLQGILGTTTPTEEQLDVYHDGAHFFEAGHAEIFNMLEDYELPHSYPLTSIGWSGDLSDYQPYHHSGDIDDFLYSPIIRDGIDNDGETGTGWADNGTARESSTVDDTIEWSGTFCSFAIDIAVQASQVTFAWDIDGGGFTQVTHQTGQSAIRPILATDRDAHTVTIKVISGTIKINRFIAI